jgi:hypothetical protein
VQALAPTFLLVKIPTKDPAKHEEDALKVRLEAVRDSSSNGYMCFQSSQIVVEISFDHQGHEYIRQSIKGSSGSLHSNRRTGRASIQDIKVEGIEVGDELIVITWLQ